MTRFFFCFLSTLSDCLTWQFAPFYLPMGSLSLYALNLEILCLILFISDSTPGTNVRLSSLPSPSPFPLVVRHTTAFHFQPGLKVFHRSKDNSQIHPLHPSIITNSPEQGRTLVFYLSSQPTYHYNNTNKQSSCPRVTRPQG